MPNTKHTNPKNTPKNPNGSIPIIVSFKINSYDYFYSLDPANSVSTLGAEGSGTSAPIFTLQKNMIYNINKFQEF